MPVITNNNYFYYILYKKKYIEYNTKTMKDECRKHKCMHLILNSIIVIN